ncbi:WG repeat-containing protein [Halpernia sp.]|uniref:WG repeat-containing protein n=1 Tax=Halpernia sp. TaxID=2782209 RepID=UPI003A91C6BF
MKSILTLFLVVMSLLYESQNSNIRKDSLIQNEFATLIPYKIKNKVVYVNQKHKMIIAPQFSLGMFFNEDCNLLNSPNEKVRTFGSSDYATVDLNKITYRIDKNGKKVYTFIKTDLGKCPSSYKSQKYKAYEMKGFYGLVDKNYIDEANPKDFVIYPQYQRLHVMEGDDINNPMLVGINKDKFGVIDKTGKIIIPFIYNDIKLNYSWKLGKMFEVSKDGKNYFYINQNNVAY